MLNNISKLRWMKSHLEIRPWQNWKHALHFTERYEHATLKTNRKELFDVKALFQVSQIKRGPRLFDSPSVTFDLKQNTFFFIYIYIYIYLLKRHLSIYCTPSVHENILGTFAFQHTAAFHYKKVVWTDTLNTTDEKHDVQMENRKLFFFLNVDIVQLELIGPFTKASLLNAQHHTVF